jgi:hypothetical protein
LRKADAKITLHERLTIERTVAQNCIVHPVRSIKRCNLRQASQARVSEVDGHIGQFNCTLPHRIKQSLFKAVRLALHAVDENAPSIPAIDPPPLKNVPWSLSTPLFGVGGWKYLVTLTSDWL